MPPAHLRSKFVSTLSCPTACTPLPPSDCLPSFPRQTSSASPLPSSPLTSLAPSFSACGKVSCPCFAISLCVRLRSYASSPPAALCVSILARLTSSFLLSGHGDKLHPDRSGAASVSESLQQLPTRCRSGMQWTRRWMAGVGLCLLLPCTISAFAPRPVMLAGGLSRSQCSQRRLCSLSQKQDVLWKTARSSRCVVPHATSAAVCGPDRSCMLPAGQRPATAGRASLLTPACLSQCPETTWRWRSG